MKIGHVGANSVHVSQFVGSLNQHGITNVLIAEETCNFEGVDNEIVTSYRKLSIPVFQKNKKRMREFLINEKPDVVHIHQFNRLAYFAAKVASSLKIPIVATAWGSDVLIIPGKNFIWKYIVKSTIKKCRVVTADADSMIVAMKKMVNDGVEYEKIQYGIEPVEGIDPKEKIIFSNRLHEPLYRIDQIIRYYSEIAADYPDYRLVIAASGSLTDHLKVLATELGLEERVEFVGWLTSKQNRSWYAKSQYYISIPSSDGTSVSLLEAISASCIPIVSDLPSNREWIEDAKNGVIETNGQNPVLKALKYTFGAGISANSEKIAQSVSRKVTTPQFISFYERCLNGK